jgi:hypothetical protein
MAQELQQAIHDICKFNPDAGWEFQIQNTIGINRDFQFTKPFSKKEKKRIDFTSVSSLINLTAPVPI